MFVCKVYVKTVDSHLQCLIHGCQEKSALSGVGVGGQQMAFSRAFIDVTMFREQNNNTPSDQIVFRKVAFAVGDLPAMQAIKCNIILGLNVFSRTRLVLCMSSRTVYLQTFV